MPVQLEPAQKTGFIAATLVTLEGTEAYTFQYNPEVKNTRFSVNYTQAPTALSELPNSVYQYANPEVLELPDLLLEGYFEEQSIRPQLGSLKILCKDGELVYFVWGSERFGPAYIESVNIVEERWLGGAPASARVSLILVRVPEDVTSTPVETEAPPEDEANTEINLTDRQREDGRKKAKEWLEANVTSLPTEVASAVQTSSYRFLTNTNGEIRITNSNGEEFGLVGIYNGDTLDTSVGDFDD